MNATTEVTNPDINRSSRAVRALFDRYYCGLNDRQRESVYSVNGPLLVLAGAGSGKTTVLVNRIAHIIRYGDAWKYAPADLPDSEIETLERMAADEQADRDEIASVLAGYAVSPCPAWGVLAITFTNKAAGEIKSRLADKLGEEAEEIWAGTFHSMCLRLLRKFCDKTGYRSGFTIYDSDDSKRLIIHCMKQLEIDDKNYPPRSVQNRISRAKDELKTPEDMTFEAGSDSQMKTIARLYTLYQEMLHENNVMDFDDIIMQTVLMLRRDKDVLDYCQRRFRYVCVDEFQDTNYAQFVLTQLISGGYRNIMVVGDDDQSIYKFRGATIENILSFDKTYPDAAVVRLEQNYRSTANILNAANAVISHNKGRHEKKLWTDRDNGDKIVIRKDDNQIQEAKFIVNTIQDRVLWEKRKYSDFAVLCRINAQMNALENVFARSGLPYRVLGGMRFYERKEIKDILAYLCIINNPADNMRLRRIINEPKRKIGETTVSLVEQIARSEGKSMFEIMEQSDRYTAVSKAAPRFREFTGMIRSLQKTAAEEKLSVLISRVIDVTGYRNMLLMEGEDALDRLQNIQELVSNAVEFEERGEDVSLNAFLEETALVADIDNYDETEGAVVIMTIHSAKGLEFPIVFLAGFEEGIFPGMQAKMNPEDLEEERRLCYVAVTRAKDRLYTTHVRERLLYGRTNYNQPSQFLADFPDDCIEREPKIATERPKREKSARNTISREFYSRSALSAAAAKTPSHSEGFTAGQRVQHQMFGRGTILSATDVGGDTLYEIAFDEKGTKKLMATFAKLKKAEE